MVQSCTGTRRHIHVTPTAHVLRHLQGSAAMLTGTMIEVEVVRAPASQTCEAQIGKVQLYPVLHSIHMDYIMRAHVTTWYGPTADYPGGWCMCYKGCDPHQDESVCYSQLVHGRSCTHTCHCSNVHVMAPACGAYMHCSWLCGPESFRAKLVSPLTFVR